MIGAYVLVDQHEDAVYVGCSGDIAQRVRSHRRAPWWSEVSDVWTYPAASTISAHTREIHLIHKLRPAHNKNHAGFVACPCGCGGA